MPLNCHDESIRPRIFQRLDYPIGRPCSCNQVSSNCLNCLVVMTIDERINCPGYIRQLASLSQRYAMRRSIARRSLFMLNGPRYLRSDVLDECSASGYIQYLHSETDCEHR